jgi:hypothetical protein
MNVIEIKQKTKTGKIEKKCEFQIWIKNLTNRRCGLSHYAIHSFFSELNQFHYNDIWLNIVEWDGDRGHVATTNGTLNLTR